MIFTRPPGGVENNVAGLPESGPPSRPFKPGRPSMHSDICGAGLLLFGLLLCEDEGRMPAELLHFRAAAANHGRGGEPTKKKKATPCRLVSLTVCACPQCSISPSRWHPTTEPTEPSQGKKRPSTVSLPTVWSETQPLVHFRSKYRQNFLSSGGYVIGKLSPAPFLGFPHLLLGKPWKGLAQTGCFSITYAHGCGKKSKREK